MASATAHARECFVRVAPVLILAASLLLATQACQPAGPTETKTASTRDDARSPARQHSPAELARSREAFLAAYKVFMHPRCMNCHPKGDAPFQGDNFEPHTQGVTRGPDGTGTTAAKCSNCHQPENLPGEHMPPGNPKWRMPGAKTPMVFEGLTPAELARHLTDPRLNGGMSLDQMLHHLTQDELVLWGWNPGEGRTLPPISQAEFAEKMRTWIDNGAAVPE